MFWKLPHDYILDRKHVTTARLTDVKAARTRRALCEVYTINVKEFMTLRGNLAFFTHPPVKLWEDTRLCPARTDVRCRAAAAAGFRSGNFKLKMPSRFWLVETRHGAAFTCPWETPRFSSFSRVLIMISRLEFFGSVVRKWKVPKYVHTFLYMYINTHIYVWTYVWV